MEISNYQLGIIFAIGSTSEGRMIFRHRNRYFLEQIQQLTGNKIYIQHSQTGPQYAFKTQNINIDELKCYGWTKRNAEQRNVPSILNYVSGKPHFSKFWDDVDMKLKNPKIET
jgi:hypothetical protein